jgi:hypothetical protein
MVKWPGGVGVDDLPLDVLITHSTLPFWMISSSWRLRSISIRLPLVDRPVVRAAAGRRASVWGPATPSRSRLSAFWNASTACWVVRP